MSGLQAVFDRLRSSRQPGLVTYVTAGDPDLARSSDVIRALDRAGADVIEVGVPFSDPVADGPAIQRASDRALAAGGHVESALDLVDGLRGRIQAPTVLFTYVNPVFSLGIEPFAARAAAAGVAGVLLLDLPIEESSEARQVFDRHGLDQIFLISPTTTDARIREAARLGRGFLYAISRLGVTGARASIAASARTVVGRIRAVTPMPIALGFGISSHEHVAEVGAFADAAVVGSAIVQVIEQADRDGQDVAAAVETFVRSLRGPRA